MRGGPPIYRFLLKFKVDEETGCWLWTARVDRKGYGQFSVSSRMTPAHRWSYEHFVGEIPDGLTIDHLCRVKNCVNPWHLEPVTASENSKRKFGVDRCKRGHDLNAPGVAYVAPSTGRRTCGVCMKEVRIPASLARRNARRDERNAYERERRRRNRDKINARRRELRAGRKDAA